MSSIMASGVLRAEAQVSLGRRAQGGAWDARVQHVVLAHRHLRAGRERLLKRRLPLGWVVHGQDVLQDAHGRRLQLGHGGFHAPVQVAHDVLHFLARVRALLDGHVHLAGCEHERRAELAALRETCHLGVNLLVAGHILEQVLERVEGLAAREC
jgi:hypothetical protein